MYQNKQGMVKCGQWDRKAVFIWGDTFVVPHLSDSRYWILDTIDSVTHGILMLLLVLGHLTLYWVHLYIFVKKSFLTKTTLSSFCYISAFSCFYISFMVCLYFSKKIYCEESIFSRLQYHNINITFRYFVRLFEE